MLGNDRTVLHGRELDVYVPEHHIAMEYDGLYWHSEDAGRDKGYHRRKTDDCAAAGISLVLMCGRMTGGIGVPSSRT